MDVKTLGERLKEDERFTHSTASAPDPLANPET